MPCVLITQRVAQREGSESRTAAKGPAISGTTLAARLTVREGVTHAAHAREGRWHGLPWEGGLS